MEVGFDINGILYSAHFPLCSERFRIASHLTKSLLVHFTSWLFLFKRRSSNLCANVIMCLLHITYQIILILTSFSNHGSATPPPPPHTHTHAMPAAPYQYVRYCCDCYCFIFTAFQRKVQYKSHLGCRHLRFGVCI